MRHALPVGDFGTRLGNQAGLVRVVDAIENRNGFGHPILQSVVLRSYDQIGTGLRPGRIDG